MTRHSSKDFARTPARLEARMPGRLIHKGVECAPPEEGFSAERKHPVFVVDLPTVAVSMTIGGLDPGGATNRHRHTYETILYVIEGRGWSEIEGVRVDWEAGDAVYVPVWAWHRHVNASDTEPCRYVAAENAPLLQNLGGVALREKG
jgi:quercetin dioxygenase-like cupin family protein